MKSNTIWSTLWRYRALTLMAVPAIVVLVINSYLPMFGVFIAFKNIHYAKGIFGSPWVGLDNFGFLFKSQAAWIITRNTVLYSLTFMLVNLIFSVLIALSINELRSRFLPKLYQTVMILPHFLSMVVVSYIVYGFLDPANGLINSIFKLFDWEAISWYTEPSYWPFLLTFINAWKGIGIGAVIYIAAIAGIDPEYYEAAVIDGASKWQQITRITIPMIRPVIIIITILSMGSIFYSDFGLFYQVTLNSGPLYPVTQTVDTYVYNSLMRLNNIGMASAAALYQSVVGFVMVIVTNWIVRRMNKEDALF